MVYFQRFSLRTNIQSTNQLDLKHAVLASIYLAAKVEEWKTGHFERLLRKETVDTYAEAVFKEVQRRMQLEVEARKRNGKVVPYSVHRSTLLSRTSE